MSRAIITEGYLTDIADAIRAKNGSSDTYTPPQMAAAIEAIPTGGGSGGRCGIFDLFTFTSAGGDGMSFAVRNNLLSIHRDSNYNWHLCTNAVVPASATKLYITIEAYRRGTSYDRWIYIGRYESSLSDTFVEIARLQDSSMSVRELLGQSSIIDLNITENDNLPFQTVVLDISDISSAFHVGFSSDYQSVYLYNIYYE